jgi:hypothetical protein
VVQPQKSPPLLPTADRDALTSRTDSPIDGRARRILETSVARGSGGSRVISQHYRGASEDRIETTGEAASLLLFVKAWSSHKSQADNDAKLGIHCVATPDGRNRSCVLLVENLDRFEGWPRIDPFQRPSGARMRGMVGVIAPVQHQRADVVVMVFAVLGVALLLEACSSSAPVDRLELRTTTTTSATSPVASAVLTAWKAAENAFYEAEADPSGLSSPLLPETMSDPELGLVKSNLAGNEAEGFIGQGSWNLGSPKVVSLGPNELDPTTATVVSCIHDTQILVNEHSGHPAAGPNGTREWAGANSIMVFTQDTWKLSQQSAVGNANRLIACAGIS